MFQYILTVFYLALTAVNCLSRTAVLKPFTQGNAFKVIAGINNFDAAIVKNVVTAACYGGASHVDLACDPSLVRLAKSIVGDSISICVSSIRPTDFVDAVEAGADMIEIGHFDGFYEKGMKFTAEDVVAMTIETRRLLPTIPLSVTVPHTLSLSEQVILAKQLEECGADIIQTEGKMGIYPTSMGVQEMIEKAAPTLASAFALSKAVKIPVMCASGLTDITAPLALAAGARGVGIGSMVNKLPGQQQMLLAVSAIAIAMGREATRVDNIEQQAENVDTKQKSSISSKSSQNL